MTSVLGRGLAAGAVGTTLLNAASYLDMFLTDRGPSSAPTATALAAADRVGLRPPDGVNRGEAFGALAGIGAGLAVGVGASAVRGLGLRLPAPLGAVAAGAAAMAATDLPMASLGVSDPATWTTADWVRDVVPHLAYGVGVRYTLDRFESRSASPAAVPPPSGRVSVGLLLGSAAVGVASGARTSFGPVAAALAGGHGRATRISSGLALLTELTVDKLPATPSRLQAGPLLGRGGAGALGAVALARREDASVLVPAVVGVLGAALGSIAGAGWRQACADNGWSWRGALAEDVVALGLTAYAVSR